MADGTFSSAAGLVAGAWFAYLFGRAMRTQLSAVLAGRTLALAFLVMISALRPAAKAATISTAGALRFMADGSSS